MKRTLLIMLLVVILVSCTQIKPENIEEGNNPKTSTMFKLPPIWTVTATPMNIIWNIYRQNNIRFDYPSTWIVLEDQFYDDITYNNGSPKGKVAYKVEYYLLYSNYSNIISLKEYILTKQEEAGEDYKLVNHKITEERINEFIALADTFQIGVDGFQATYYQYGNNIWVLWTNIGINSSTYYLEIFNHMKYSFHYG